jgi:signal transduction histidine kinase
MDVSWLLVLCGAGGALAAQLRLWRRRELVARACHEVRGPLGAVALGLHAVEREDADAAARIAALQLELRRAALALDDLGGRRRRNSGGDPEWVDVGELMALQAGCWDDVARAHGGAVRVVDVPPRGRAVVLGDRVRLAQALGNLVANSVEHGGGSVELSARVTDREVRVEVADHGPGLPAPVSALTRRARLRFGRGTRGRGLAIASAVAARHGGRVHAAPSARGARVVLDLPLAGR